MIEIQDRCRHWWPSPKKWMAWVINEPNQIAVQRYGWTQAEARLKVIEFFMEGS